MPLTAKQRDELLAEMKVEARVKLSVWQLGTVRPERVELVNDLIAQRRAKFEATFTGVLTPEERQKLWRKAVELVEVDPPTELQKLRDDELAARLRVDLGL